MPSALVVAILSKNLSVPSRYDEKFMLLMLKNVDTIQQRTNSSQKDKRVSHTMRKLQFHF